MTKVLKDPLNACAKKLRSCTDCNKPIEVAERYRLGVSRRKAHFACARCAPSAARRQRQAKTRREHDEVMRDLGLTKTAYGWE